MSFGDHSGDPYAPPPQPTGDRALLQRLREQAAAEFIKGNDTAAQLLRDAASAIERLMPRTR